MEELDLITSLVSTLAKGLKVPVTCKTRVYKDYARSLRLCETLVAAGASLLTIHGRTREEKGQFVAQADWETIRKLKAHFAGRVPIIANGGIETADDVDRCIEATGVDGVMSSEAILENPGMFSKGIDSQGLFKTQLDLAEEYIDLCRSYPVWHYKSIRSHLQKYLHRYFCVHTELRVECAKACTLDAFMAVVHGCKAAVALAGNRDEFYDEKWYFRHKNPSHVFSGRVSTLLIPEKIVRDDRIWDCVSLLSLTCLLILFLYLFSIIVLNFSCRRAFLGTAVKKHPRER